MLMLKVNIRYSISHANAIFVRWAGDRQGIDGCGVLFSVMYPWVYMMPSNSFSPNDYKPSLIKPCDEAGEPVVSVLSNLRLLQRSTTMGDMETSDFVHCKRDIL